MLKKLNIEFGTANAETEHKGTKKSANGQKKAPSQQFAVTGHKGTKKWVNYKKKGLQPIGVTALL